MLRPLILLFAFMGLVAGTALAHEGHHELKPNQAPPSSDPVFDQAVAHIMTGDAEALRGLLKAHPELATQRAAGHQEYEQGYFANPTLLHFTAFNPWWHGETVVPATTPAVVQELLAVGADPDAGCGEPINNHWTVLGLITSGVKTREAGVEDAMIELLAEAGADLNLGVGGAIIYSDWAAMDTLIRLGVEDTPMVLAVKGDAEALRGKLAAADDPELVQRVLFAAVVKGNTVCVQAAIDFGADSNAFMPSPMHPHATAMHQAAWNDHVEVLEVLVANGGRTDVKDKVHGGTPLGWALHGHHDEAAAYLFPLTEIDPTPQQLAAWGLAEPLAALLDERPEALHEIGDWGTCLQQASFHGRVEVVQMLLDRGADVHQIGDNPQTPGGFETPLDSALSNNLSGSGASLEDRAAIAALLKERGAQPGAGLGVKTKPAD
ncbi:MAG: ankyrin repeat domain-containing protein [Planctomycetota bacterium]